jgi:uncharacterized protein
MLPQFPHFKELQLSDAEDVQRYTSRYAPFSDFNFAALWSWNVDDSVLLSELNGNLVVRLADYVTGDFFYSFLGTTEVNGTVGSLLNLSSKESLQPRLQLIPEVTAEQLDAEAFSITEDDNQADYILLVDRLCGYQGPQFGSKRNEMRKFLKYCPQARFEPLNLEHASIIEQSQQLFHRWNNRPSGPGDGEGLREFTAFKRCLTSQAHLRLMAAGVFVDGLLVAISLFEIIDHKYAIAHFEKADTTNYPGIGSYLNQKVASMLATQGVQYINIEQDLGIAGLRKSKRSYFPCGYLKKFNIGYHAHEAA